MCDVHESCDELVLELKRLLDNTEIDIEEYARTRAKRLGSPNAVSDIVVPFFSLLLSSTPGGLALPADDSPKSLEGMDPQIAGTRQPVEKA